MENVKSYKELLKIEERKQALAYIKSILKKTKKDKYSKEYRLTVKIERVAPSGMSRCMSIYAVSKDGRHYNITKGVAIVTENTFTSDGYLRVGGCGMDMIFHVLYCLNGDAIYLDNYKGKKKNHYNYLVSTRYDYI